MKNGIVCVAVLALTGCPTFQISGTNNSKHPLVYQGTVDGTSDAVLPLNVGKSLPVTTVGDYLKGDKVGITVLLPRGGKVSEQYQKLPGRPDPFLLNVNIDSIPGIELDLEDAGDVEKVIEDVSNSFLSPSALVNTIIDAELGGVFLVTDNPEDPAAPQSIPLFRASDLHVTVPANFMEGGQFPMDFHRTMILDKNAAAQVKGEIPTLAKFALDFSTSEIYKFDFTLKNTGWRTLPVSWYSIQKGLQTTAEGRGILDKIKITIAGLKPNQHVYFMDSAYIIGSVDVSNYQSTLLSTSANVDAESYVTLNAAYKFSSTAADTKNDANIVMRVRYQDLSLVEFADVAPSAVAMATEGNPRDAAVAAKFLRIIGDRKPVSIIAKPAIRPGKRALKLDVVSK
ncbi:hypothetical protein [Burkholderia pseudomallei]